MQSYTDNVVSNEHAKIALAKCKEEESKTELFCKQISPTTVVYCKRKERLEEYDKMYNKKVKIE